MKPVLVLLLVLASGTTCAAPDPWAPRHPTRSTLPSRGFEASRGSSSRSSTRGGRSVRTA
ncbi:MAG: hypothetical protein HY901_15935 [Deltaproteobacteria bacterium]|nr:hypothetical protein [Deltaproteobacteria bacterium]